MIAKEELGLEVLLEAQKQDVDHYFNLLKKHGWYDFVDDFVQPEWNIDGVRIDMELNYPKTITVDKNRCENSLNILLYGCAKIIAPLDFFTNEFTKEARCIPKIYVSNPNVIKCTSSVVISTPGITKKS